MIDKDDLVFQLDMAELEWLADMVFAGLEDARPRVVEKMLMQPRARSGWDSVVWP